MANLDPNTWYQVYNNDSGPAYGLFVAFPNPPPYGAVFLSPFNQTSTNQQWQILHAPGQSGPYLLRSSYLGPNYFMGVTAQTGISCGANGCNTVPDMVPTNLTDNSTQWTFGPWQDGSFYMWNAANGTSFLMNIQPDRILLKMDSDINSNLSGEQWSFSSIAPINDTAFATVVTTTTASTSTTTTLGTSNLPVITTPSSSPSPAQTSSVPTSTSSSTPNTSSGGLSSGASAAIGASIGGVALIIIALTIFIFFRRRKRQKFAPNATDSRAAPTYDRAETHEPTQQMSELPTDYTPELPADYTPELPDTNIARPK